MRRGVAKDGEGEVFLSFSDNRKVYGKSQYLVIRRPLLHEMSGEQIKPLHAHGEGSEVDSLLETFFFKG